MADSREVLAQQHGPCRRRRSCRLVPYRCIIQVLLVVSLAGCAGNQSALAPAGDEAERVFRLTATMAIAGCIIWLGVVGLLVASLSGRRRPIEARNASRLIFWGGVVFPTLVLVLLLTYALWLMPGLRPLSETGDPQLTVDVTGRQFWWDVTYRLPDGRTLRTANELVFPVGQRVELSLRSTDVIHSFWVPALAGKVDMIPGRINRLSILPTKSGRFRGPCAEFCGTSHALMFIEVTTTSPEDFERWVARQIVPSRNVDQAGAALFIKHGCASCHRVAGTQADSDIGPDLSHVGSRQAIAAGVLPNTTDNIARFIAQPNSFKPGVQMPAFGMVPSEDLHAISVWLKGLE